MIAFMRPTITVVKTLSTKNTLYGCISMGEQGGEVDGIGDGGAAPEALPVSRRIRRRRLGHHIIRRVLTTPPPVVAGELRNLTFVDHSAEGNVSFSAAHSTTDDDLMTLVFAVQNQAAKTI